LKMMFEVIVTVSPVVCGSNQLLEFGPNWMVAEPVLPAVPMVLLRPLPPCRDTVADVLPALFPT